MRLLGIRDIHILCTTPVNVGLRMDSMYAAYLFEGDQILLISNAKHILLLRKSRLLECIVAIWPLAVDFALR